METFLTLLIFGGVVPSLFSHSCLAVLCGAQSSKRKCSTPAGRTRFDFPGAHRFASVEASGFCLHPRDRPRVKSTGTHKTRKDSSSPILSASVLGPVPILAERTGPFSRPMRYHLACRCSPESNSEKFPTLLLRRDFPPPFDSYSQIAPKSIATPEK
jgi:hypothetical protein